MTDALAEALCFLTIGPRFALSQPGRRGTIRQIPIDFPEHGHFGLTDSTASNLHRERDRSILHSPRSVSHLPQPPARPP